MRARLDAEQVERILALRERGWSYEALARKFDVSSGAIHYRCLMNGAVSPNQRRHPVPTQPISLVASDGRIQRRFTQAEDARLLELAASGLSRAEIARAIGRPRTSVRIRLLTLALREELPDV